MLKKKTTCREKQWKDFLKINNVFRKAKYSHVVTEKKWNHNIKIDKRLWDTVDTMA